MLSALADVVYIRRAEVQAALIRPEMSVIWLACSACILAWNKHGLSIPVSVTQQWQLRWGGSWCELGQISMSSSACLSNDIAKHPSTSSQGEQISGPVHIAHSRVVQSQCKNCMPTDGCVQLIKACVDASSIRFEQRTQFDGRI